jgi:BirA family transcriptional regulator, biotin operon repressor / biotin---[acetyl-CoA-carboxylase] ligase
VEKQKLFKTSDGTEVYLHEYDCVNSTNTLLLSMARQGAPVGTVVWAHTQDGGRGRLGRSFSSPEGGVYLSLLVPCPANLEEVGFALTAKIGVAVKRTIDGVTGKHCGIKWVNDIILEHHKVCGILAQMCSEVPDKTVVGIGINYTTDPSYFAPELRDIAGSICEFVPELPPMEAFVTALIDNVYALVGPNANTKNNNSWLKEYKSSSTILGNQVKVLQAGTVIAEGTASSIDDQCHLHVITKDGKEMVLSTGEVSVRNL